MNIEELLKILLAGQQELLQRVTSVESKLTASLCTNEELKQSIEDLDDRVSKLEQAPATKWKTIPSSALAAIAAAVYFLK